MSAAELARRCHVRGRRLGSEDAAVVWTHAVVAWLGTPEGADAARCWGEREAVERHREALLARALAPAMAL